MSAYAELHCLSNFSFQRGASTAQELFERARKLGYRALAITDECTLAGIVRAHEAAQATGLALIVGSEFRLVCGIKLVLLATDHGGYSAICGFITRARRAAEKGEYQIGRVDFPGLVPGVVALWIPDEAVVTANTLADASWFKSRFPGRSWIAVELHQGPGDAARLAGLRDLSFASGLPMVACGDVHMHERARRPLHDVLTAVRHHCSVREAGYRLLGNGERHLRTPGAIERLYPANLIEESLHISELCTFSLNHLRYEYPKELVPHARTASDYLRELTEHGIRERWPAGVSPAVRAQLEYELALIAELKYESYFLTVHDIVRFARSRDILCQGRGSAANSAVCYALRITEVDPARGNLLFERFISRERNEPPDIDVDFEHERREEVIQYIYSKYGRERAALAATVISYRAKSAIRDVGKALGLALDQVDQIASSLAWWDGFSAIEDRLVERGFDPASPQIRKLMKLVSQVLGFPRHLSQHVGGFVISERPLSELVPVENAAMPDRTIIQWDKDDLDTLGLLKVDCLALGMLSCIRRCFDLIEAWETREANAQVVRVSQRRTREESCEPAPGALRLPGIQKLTLASIPAEDPATYAMLKAGDSVGVFQVESRAQMAMLPRLKPENFYDLVVQVAIVRPGPIQGKMVHPYLRRRQGLEPVSYPSEDLRRVFERTLGVPIFQEQVMQLAIVAAGFTPGEADQLRRSMAAWKRRGGMEHYRKRIIDGMSERGYEIAFAEQVFEQIKGFGSYGFPESHAASFALLVYASAWLKCHHPAAFACALLNAQPLGFYSVDQIVQDARRHGIAVRPVDVRFSEWDARLESEAFVGPDLVRTLFGEPRQKRSDKVRTHESEKQKQPTIRLGLREIRGLKEAAAVRLVEARAQRPFTDVQELAERALLDRGSLETLGRAGALIGLAGHRHRAQWAVTGVMRHPDLFAGARVDEEKVVLRPPSPSENVLADYASVGLTLGTHPLKLLRPQLRARCYRTLAEAQNHANGTPVRVAGLISLRQRPGTASGVTFVTLEDESGWLNLIVWRDLAERQRRVLLESQLVGVHGELQKADGVTHVLARRLENLTSLLGGLDARSRDFH